MSVFWDEGRRALEAWSRDVRTPGTPAWNPFFSPEPDHLLRVAIALGFKRGPLEDAYGVLRGRDRKTGKVSAEARETQFARLADAQARTLDTGVWKEFLQSLIRAGHRSSATISSNLAIVYSYAFYVIGKHDYGVPLKQLRDVIARWFFMTTLTGRYSFSPESRAGSDLAALPAETTPDAFVAHLGAVIDQQLTNDFWEIRLPGDLATSASRSPTLFAYLAALNILDAQVLFSKMRCSELLDPVLAGGKPKLQRHHLFPKKYLEGIGITDVKQVNQIANLALLEWHDNLAIAANDPTEYWPAYLDAMRTSVNGMPQFSDGEIERMLNHHALPQDWPALDYEDFLAQRRRLMAKVIREAFTRLSEGAPDAPHETWPPSEAAIEHLLREGESARVEMKSSLRADTLDRGVPPKVLEKVVARTVAGFLNSHGGILVIGVDDFGRPLGLERDIRTLQRKDTDGFQQALVQVLVSYLGADIAAAVRFHMAKIGTEAADVALIDCPPHAHPVVLQDGNDKELHVRTGNTTRLMDIQEAIGYIAQHWKSAA